jgi:hydroxymethylpyrimidine/phosphomethylpyrimidine kinase
MKINGKNTSEGVISSVLVLGGLDPSGGAGILIDSAAIRSTGLHCLAVPTINTVQNGLFFSGYEKLSVENILDSVGILLQNHRIAAIKIGAVGDLENINAICLVFEGIKKIPIVVDPVLASTTGGMLLKDTALKLYIEKIIPRADLFTPNIPEASKLAGINIKNRSDMETAADILLKLGCRSVLIKGGHLLDEKVYDLLKVDTKSTWFESSRDLKGEIRGTGCALASLSAAHLVLGKTLESSVSQARDRLSHARKKAYLVGAGPRVLNFS